VEVNRWTNVEVVEAAVAAESGTLTITDDETSELNDVFRGGDIQVRAVTLDDLAEEYGIEQIDYLKMNIEGAEKLAVRGMEQIADRVIHAFIACHDFLYDRDPNEVTAQARTHDEVLSWLTDHCFEVRERPEDPRDWVSRNLYATKSSSTPA